MNHIGCLLFSFIITTFPQSSSLQITLSVTKRFISIPRRFLSRSPGEEPTNNDVFGSSSRLEDSIDSFLLPNWNKQDDEDDKDTISPNPNMGPGETIDTALRAIRFQPEKDGAETLLRFCTPLSRREKWGNENDAWKEVLRGAITPVMLSRRIRASSFSGLLDWTKLSVTEGYSTTSMTSSTDALAFVNAAMFFGDGVEPCIITFTLKKMRGVWLIDTAVVSKREWFVDKEEE